MYGSRVSFPGATNWSLRLCLLTAFKFVPLSAQMGWYSCCCSAAPFSGGHYPSPEWETLLKFLLKSIHSFQAGVIQPILALKTLTFCRLKRSIWNQSDQSLPPSFWRIFWLQHTFGRLICTFLSFLLTNAICILGWAIGTTNYVTSCFGPSMVPWVFYRVLALVSAVLCSQKINIGYLDELLCMYQSSLSCKPMSSK